MPKTIRALFDGEVLRPEQPVDLEPQKTYEILIEREVPTREIDASAEYPLSQIAELATDLGVEDLASEHDRYAHRRIDREQERA